MQHGRRVHAMLAQLQQLCIIYSNLVQTMAAVAARRDRQRASEPRPQLLAPSMESACVHAQLYGRAAALARPCSRPLATRLSFARPSPRWVLQCLLGQSRGGTNSQLKPSCLCFSPCFLPRARAPPSRARARLGLLRVYNYTRFLISAALKGRGRTTHTLHRE